MTAIYTFNAGKLEHHLICDGKGAVFGIDGKYKGSNAVMGTAAKEVDVISLLQQGELCEIAALTNNNYAKRQLEMSAYSSWVNTVPVRPIGTFVLRRKVGEERCVQTIYIFNRTAGIAQYLRNLLG